MKKIRTDLQEKIDKITPNIGDKEPVFSIFYDII